MTPPPRLPAIWRKSSHSPSEGGSCVEVGMSRGSEVAVRDSKLDTSWPFPCLTISATEWMALLANVKPRS